MSKIIVACGGRDLIISDQDCARSLLARVSGCHVHLLIHGNAKGADAAINRAAHLLAWPCLAISADWQRHGRCAGPIRNQQLLQLAIEKAIALQLPTQEQISILVIAFPGGKGTADLIQQARKLSARSAVPIAIRQISASEASCGHGTCGSATSADASSISLNPICA
ncbi:SLOG family protein [uncultured Synechococcus sp.]|uniref:SLOG family protein n=1 Tax=uncultured Synechococcus sp. TaxID=154535 RepID=UPI0025998A8E|nr:SLOG family protein [uncultured Synechococcus sp.]